ncbi:hypothetical protein [Empedobacter sp.]|nr:hypothetical protein [Empedobacter sp.]
MVSTATRIPRKVVPQTIATMLTAINNLMTFKIKKVKSVKSK